MSVQDNSSSSEAKPPLPPGEDPWYIRSFAKTLIGFGLGGGAAAIFAPLALWGIFHMDPSNVDQLRLHLLYVSGGIIAILTLLQTNWKNQVDRRKVDADITKNKQDAAKNERDHIRQVHAERRSRYTTAVEQLAHNEPPIRLGGIYTLVGLVDEWLADNTLTPEEQQKEGQVIINSLCSYIRSPFPLATKTNDLQSATVPADYEGDFVTNQATLREEQDVRRAIFDEISKRSSIVTKIERGKVSVAPGVWKNFDFDFSRAQIFYPLNNLTIEKANFSAVRFYGKTNFFNTIFVKDANFSKTSFDQNVNFTEATFAQNVNFTEATFAQTATFNKATFAQTATFNKASFAQTATFSKAIFDQTTTFWRATFVKDVTFWKATFNQEAKFLGTTFTKDATYWLTVFAQDAIFTNATFKQKANFWNATFKQKAHFVEATFKQKAHFIGTTFTQNADFSNAMFEENSPDFVHLPKDSDKATRARFAALPKNQGIHRFTVREGSKPIDPGTATLTGKPFIIPVGTVLFNIRLWNGKKRKYVISEPAKPLDNNSGEEENKSE